MLGKSFDTKLNRILIHYSPKEQTVQAIEELAELQKELAKILNGKGDQKALIGELADALIMIYQLIPIYEVDYKELEETMEYKVDRQIKRIEEEAPKWQKNS